MEIWSEFREWRKRRSPAVESPKDSTTGLLLTHELKRAADYFINSIFRLIVSRPAVNL